MKKNWKKVLVNRWKTKGLIGLIILKRVWNEKTIIAYRISLTILSIYFPIGYSTKISSYMNKTKGLSSPLI